MTQSKNKQPQPDQPAANGTPAAEPATPPAAEPGAKTAAPPDAAPQAASAPAPTPQAEAELAACRDRCMRLMADFDNFRRRVSRERDELAARASESLVVELLPVLDHFDLAMKQATSATDPFVVGMRLVHDQMMDVLSRAGLQKVDAADTPFDPAEHEAVAYLPSHDVPEGGVIQQTRRGYRMGDRVIRPATVVVSSGAPPADAPPEAPAEPPPPEKKP